jgi:hypothetical protein
MHVLQDIRKAMTVTVAGLRCMQLLLNLSAAFLSSSKAVQTTLPAVTLLAECLNIAASMMKA